MIGQADGRDALDWSAEGILFKARRDIRLPVARYYGTCVVLPTQQSLLSPGYDNKHTLTTYRQATDGEIASISSVFSLVSLCLNMSWAVKS